MMWKLVYTWLKFRLKLRKPISVNAAAFCFQTEFQRATIWDVECVIDRVGVEDTRLEAKAKDSLSEDRPSRGHGQKCLRPRTKDTAASVLKKKRSSKKFFRQSPTLRRSQNFWLGRPKLQITCNDVIKIFQTRNFSWYKDIVGWKIWNRCLSALNHDFAKREGSN